MEEASAGSLAPRGEEGQGGPGFQEVQVVSI